MSWLSEFVHSPLDYIQENPWKAAALIGGPIAAIAAPWALPELGAAVGIGGAAEGIGAGLGAAEGGAAFGASDAAGAFGLGGAESGALGFSASEGGLDAMAGIEGTIPDSGLSSFLSNPGSVFNDAGMGSDLGGANALSDPTFADKWANMGLPDYNAPPNAYASTGAEGAGSYGPSQAEMDAISGTVPGGSPDVASGTIDAAAGKAAAGAPGDQSFMGGMWDSAKGYATAHPFQTAAAGIAGLGLGYNILNGQRTSPNVTAMQGSAQAMNAQAQQLMSYLQKGTLPPGLQAAVTNATNAMKARYIANAAKNGMPTDPSQNSALAQDLNSVDSQAFAMIAQQGVQLLNSGISMAGISNQLYAMLENLDRQKSQQTGAAIANFAAALNGGGTIRMRAA